MFVRINNVRLESVHVMCSRYSGNIKNIGSVNFLTGSWNNNVMLITSSGAWNRIFLMLVWNYTFGIFVILFSLFCFNVKHIFETIGVIDIPVYIKHRNFTINSAMLTVYYIKLIVSLVISTLNVFLFILTRSFVVNLLWEKVATERI